MPKEKEEKEKPVKNDSWIEDLFDAYKQSIMLIVVFIIYSIIPGAIGYLGYYLAQKGGVDFTGIISDPSTLLEGQIHYGLYIMAVSAVLIVVSFFASFIFTASRNDRIAKPLKMGKAYLDTWGILLSFALIAVIFGGLYFGLSYLENTTINYVFGIIAAVIAVFTPVAMVFRAVDFLLELE